MDNISKYYDSVIRKIKVFKDKNNLSCSDLSKKFFVDSRNTVEKWLNGKQKPSFDSFPAICDAIGCDMGSLLGIYPERNIVYHKVSSLTGLSEQAIEKLISYQIHDELMDENLHLGFINKLLSSETTYSVLDGEKENLITIIADCIRDIETYSKTDPDDITHAQSGCMWKIQQAITDLVVEYIRERKETAPE